MNRSLAMLIASLFVIAPATRAQDAAAGKTLFEQCAACHTIDGTNSPVGPTLKGIFNRKAGSVPGFRYSRAMKSAAVVWDERALDAYLADPQTFMPGNLMPFAGMTEAGERAALIAYLKSLP